MTTTLPPLTTKLSKVTEAADRGDWSRAILLAAKFQDLGDHRDAILSAREAINRPDFQRQLKRDPDTLIKAGVTALRARYHL